MFVRPASRFAFNTGIYDAIFRHVVTRTVLAFVDVACDPWSKRGFLISRGGKSGCSPRDLARLGEGIEIGRCALVVGLGSNGIHECDNFGLQILSETCASL